MPFFLAQLWFVLKEKLGWTTSVVLLIIASSGWYVHDRYKNEKAYHAWAGSYETHHFDEDQVEVRKNVDGEVFVRVFWVSWPKVAESDFSEQYILFRVGKEPVGIYLQTHPIPAAMPYRYGYGMTSLNKKYPNDWGSWIRVGKLDPGKYEIKIHYDYDKWWYPDWNADQHIVFEVK